MSLKSIADKVLKGLAKMPTYSLPSQATHRSWNHKLTHSQEMPMGLMINGIDNEQCEYVQNYLKAK